MDDKIATGRFKNAGEVIRAGLRLLEEEESRIVALKRAIEEGFDSGTAQILMKKAILRSSQAEITLKWGKIFLG